MQTKRKNMYLLKNIVTTFYQQIIFSGSFYNHITKKLFKKIFVSGVRKKKAVGGGGGSERYALPYTPFYLLYSVM